MKRVVVADFITEPLDVERDVLQELATVEALDAYSEADLRGRVEHADAVMLYHNLAITQTTIELLKNCKLIVRCGAGFDNVDHACAGTRGIPVANVPDYGTEEVADSAIGMTLALTRGINFYNTQMRTQTDPWMYHVAAPLHRLRERVFGIIGLGRIGTATAIRAKSLGMDVRFYDPFKPDGYDKAIGCTRVETLKELMRQSFVVSAHVPLSEQTRHMINADTIAWMQKGSYLVNTSRGGVVDTDVIPRAIESGQLAGAAIDVLVGEPPQDDNPLLVAWRDPAHPAHRRLIVNPHAAFYCEEGLMDMRRKGAEACRRALSGQVIRNVIN